MGDVFSPEKRSNIMSLVRSKGNKSTELKLIEFFKSQGITGWKRNYNVIGHPDFVFSDRKIAVFVDGCFWHGHNCRNITPSQNKEYWEQKRVKNIAHDKIITKRFEQRGWLVIRIWECELKRANQAILVDKLSAVINH